MEKHFTTTGGYETKIAVSYQSYTDMLPSGTGEFIVKKLTS